MSHHETVHVWKLVSGRHVPLQAHQKTSADLLVRHGYTRVRRKSDFVKIIRGAKSSVPALPTEAQIFNSIFCLPHEGSSGYAQDTFTSSDSHAQNQTKHDFTDGHSSTHAGAAAVTHAVYTLKPLDADFDLYISGESLLRKFVQRPKWVRRRVDSLQFEDHMTGFLRSTVDLDLEGGWRKSGPIWRDLVLLPVHSLRRERDYLLSLTADGGRALVQLSRREERCLIAAGLVLKLMEACEKDGIELPKSTEDDLTIYHWVLGNIDPESFGHLLDSPATQRFEADIDNLPERWRHFVTYYCNYRLVILALSGPIDAQSELSEDPQNRLPDLTANGRFFIEREVDLPAAKGPDLRHLRLRNLQPMGRVVVDLTANGAASCESYHFTVTPPPNVFVERIDVQLTQRYMDGQTIHTRRSWHAVESAAIREAHAFVANDIAYYNGQPVLRDDAKLFISLRPMTMGLMRSGLLVSFLAFSLIAFFFATAGWAASGYSSIIPSITISPDVNSMVTIIALGPTLLGAIALRQEEHLLTKRVAASYRAALVVQVAFSVVVASIFAVGLNGCVLAWLCAVCFVGSCAVVIFQIQLYRASRGPLSTIGHRRTVWMGEAHWMASSAPTIREEG